MIKYSFLDELLPLRLYMHKTAKVAVNGYHMCSDTLRPSELESTLCNFPIPSSPLQTIISCIKTVMRMEQFIFHRLISQIHV